MKVELLTITPNAEKHLEHCGRICYNSENKITEASHERFLKSVMSLGHVAILSHAFATFRISDISRACSHQLVRHAHLRYLQKSQRYCVEKEWKDFIRPPKTSGEETNERGDTAFDLLEDAVFTSYNSYAGMMDLGVHQEDARYALSNAHPTEIIISGTLQAWYDFLRIRLTKHAQWEIRDVARDIYNVLKKECPHIFTKELLEKQPKIELDVKE